MYWVSLQTRDTVPTDTIVGRHLRITTDLLVCTERVSKLWRPRCVVIDRIEELAVLFVDLTEHLSVDCVEALHIHEQKSQRDDASIQTVVFTQLSRRKACHARWLKTSFLKSEWDIIIGACNKTLCLFDINIIRKFFGKLWLVFVPRYSGICQK